MIFRRYSRHHWPHKFRGVRGGDPMRNPWFRTVMIDAFAAVGWR